MERIEHSQFLTKGTFDDFVQKGFLEDIVEANGLIRASSYLKTTTGAGFSPREVSRAVKTILDRFSLACSWGIEWGMVCRAIKQEETEIELARRRATSIGEFIPYTDIYDRPRRPRGRRGAE